jgi:hypothetical protein
MAEFILRHLLHAHATDADGGHSCVNPFRSRVRASRDKAVLAVETVRGETLLSEFLIVSFRV